MAELHKETIDAVVKWLNGQASYHRIVASKIIGIHKRELELAKATAYEGAAFYIAVKFC